MWLLFGLIAIVATFINLYLFKVNKDYKLAMALGLSFTALTLSAQYSMVSNWIQIEDYAAIFDVVITMSKLLWILTIISIFLNILPIFLDFKKSRIKK